MASSVEKIVVRLNGKFHEVSKAEWEKQTLEKSIVGDARVVVKRGALVADIPSDVPFGTFCILVNLAALEPNPPPGPSSSGGGPAAKGPAANVPGSSAYQTEADIKGGS